MGDDQSVREALTGLMKSLGYRAATFRSTEELIPTVLITPYPNETARARALRAGVKGYRTKPFRED